MENKNIDRLFQEQLKNLEATPDKKVWNNIESKLKNKKRGILPFWWFSGGIAAVLMLGLLFYPFKNKENNNPVIITETPKNKIDIDKKTHKNIDTLLLHKNNPDAILVAEEKKNIKTLKTKKNKRIKPKEKIIIAKIKTEKPINKKKLVSTKKAMKKILLADNSSTEIINSKEKEIKGKKMEHQLEINQKKNKQTTEVLKEKSSSKKRDLEAFIIKKDSVYIHKQIKNKWALAPTFAILNSNSFSNTSPIDKNLANSTQGKNTYSYGVQIAYKINSKWAIQSGIHLQEMSYANNQIIVAKTTRNSPAVSFSNANKFSSNKNASVNFDSATNSLTNTISSNGNLVQNYGYIEIPLELKYNFSNNKKFETQLVAGFSSLFLNKNVVTLNTATFSESVKAKNLNNINFSGNLGFDFNYFFNTNWSLNINPMFKAQLNTFSNDSNGFAPFNIGIYTGIKYTF